jgi:hypothetical protein
MITGININKLKKKHIGDKINKIMNNTDLLVVLS